MYIASPRHLPSIRQAPRLLDAVPGRPRDAAARGHRPGGYPPSVVTSPGRYRAGAVPRALPRGRHQRGRVAGPRHRLLSRRAALRKAGRDPGALRRAAEKKVPAFRSTTWLRPNITARAVETGIFPISEDGEHVTQCLAIEDFGQFRDATCCRGVDAPPRLRKGSEGLASAADPRVEEPEGEAGWGGGAARAAHAKRQRDSPNV